MRGLNANILYFIKNSDNNIAVTIRAILKDIKDGNKNKLFFGIRENSIAIYSKGARVIEINFNKDGNVKDCKTNIKYLDENYKGKSRDEKIPLDIISVRYFYELLEKVNNYIIHGKDSKTIEKQYQQQLMLSNNDPNINSKWFCYDIEYYMGKYGYGRYDILAVTTVANKYGEYSISLVEVKVDKSSFGTDGNDIKGLLEEGKVVKISRGKYEVRSKLDLAKNKYKYSLGSGILGHFSDYIRYINDEEYLKEKGVSRFDTTKQELVTILNNYIELGLYNEQVEKIARILTVERISNTPKFLFLNYAKNIEVKKLRESFKNYVLGTSDLSIAKVWNEKIIDKYNQKNSQIQFKCIFRDKFPEDEANREIFSDVEISEAKNIFDEEAYK